MQIIKGLTPCFELEMTQSGEVIEIMRSPKVTAGVLYLISGKAVVEIRVARIECMHVPRSSM